MAWSRVARHLAYVTLLVFVCLVSASVTILLLVPGFEWLPQHDEARTLLAALLTAQAAIAALTLAVTLFVIQGVSTRRDANDRMYREYLQQSWVRQILCGSIVAVVVGGVVFMAQEFVGGVETVANMVPGLKNLTLLSVISFGGEKAARAVQRARYTGASYIGGAKHAETRLRRCVVVGTTNRRECLPNDETGNRRFVAIEIGSGQPGDVRDYLGANRAQLWAEGLARCRAGEHPRLPDAYKGVQAKHNEGYRAADDALETKVGEWLRVSPEEFTLAECGIATWTNPFPIIAAPLTTNNP